MVKETADPGVPVHRAALARAMGDGSAMAAVFGAATLTGRASDSCWHDATHPVNAAV